MHQQLKDVVYICLSLFQTYLLMSLTPCLGHMLFVLSYLIEVSIYIVFIDSNCLLPLDKYLGPYINYSNCIRSMKLFHNIFVLS